MAELADALDLGSSAFRRAGSIPVTRTNLINQAHVELKKFKKVVLLSRTNLINQAHVEWSRELFDYLLQLLNKRMLLDVLLLTWQ